jgi:predicted small secreted protein
MKRTVPLLFIIVATLTLAACATPPSAGEPVAVRHGGADADAQLEFWHALHDRRLTSNDDAFHGMLLFLDGKDEATDYAGRVATLKSRGMLPDDFDRPADEAVTRGTLAVIVTQGLKLKGGLALSLLPQSPRYATRELLFAGLFPQGSANQTLTGGQFVAIVGRLEDYQRRAAAVSE